MKNKYVCPKCNSRLKVYREYVLEKQRLINPETGILNKKIITTKAEKLDTPGGLECTKCDFIYYGLDSKSNKGEKYEYLDTLFEMINEQSEADEIQ